MLRPSTVMGPSGMGAAPSGRGGGEGPGRRVWGCDTSPSFLALQLPTSSNYPPCPNRTVVMWALKRWRKLKINKKLNYSATQI